MRPAEFGLVFLAALIAAVCAANLWRADAYLAFAAMFVVIVLLRIWWGRRANR